jgi:hypothetical protein
MLAQITNTSNNSHGSFASDLSYGLTIGSNYSWSKLFRSTVNLSLNQVSFISPANFTLSGGNQYLLLARVGGEFNLGTQLRLGGFLGIESLPTFSRLSVNRFNIRSTSFPHAGIYLVWNFAEFIKANFGFTGKFMYYLPSQTALYNYTSNYGYRLGLSLIQKKNESPWSYGAELYYQNQSQTNSTLNGNLVSFGLDWIISIN